MTPTLTPAQAEALRHPIGRGKAWQEIAELGLIERCERGCGYAERPPAGRAALEALEKS
jgi:hypothetical protein